MVLDTNVVVAALRSPGGASAALVELALDQTFVLLLSVPLVLEYEAVASDTAQRTVSGLSEAEVRTVISALCSVCRPIELWFLWRPQLRDPADEMVLETAINGRAEALVTFNLRDFAIAAGQFAIDVITPQQALRRVRR